MKLAARRAPPTRPESAGRRLLYIHVVSIAHSLAIVSCMAVPRSSLPSSGSSTQDVFVVERTSLRAYTSP